MKYAFNADVVNKEQIILLCSKALRLYDDRLIDHGERVAYIAACIFNELKKTKIDISKLLILCLFHDVGAYKTEEIDRMLEFESSHVWEHSVYGYLFLRYFTPLGEAGEAVLYHHKNESSYDSGEYPYREYSNLIHLADRLDVAINNGIKKDKIVSSFAPGRFAEDQVRALDFLLNNTGLYEDVISGKFKEIIFEGISKTALNSEDALNYLRMLVHTIDFKSKYTVVHSINITSISAYLASKLDLTEKETEKIYFASLVHDLGKLAIPVSILEFPGKLTSEEMDIMKTHVCYTESIAKGVIPDDILNIAIRHHEKLDGSGYPRGLKGDQLSVSDRIVAVADIFSALISRRSYKDKFDRDKTLTIMTRMADDGQIDGQIVSILNDNYEEIVNISSERTRPMFELYYKVQSEYIEKINALESF